MELIKNNYLYGTGHGNTWHVNIDPPKRKVKTYFEETLEAVEYIHANKTGKFLVLYSGGLDSQYVCQVLLYLKIDFDPVIIQLKNNSGDILNIHDIAYAFEFCKAKSIKPIVYDVNFEKFVESGKINTIAEYVHCCIFSIPATLYVAKKLDGYSIIADGQPYIKYNASTNTWLFEELEYAHSSLRYYEKNNLNGTPFLLSYTPEMMLAFLLDPSIIKLGTGQCPGKTGSNSSKSYVYNNKSNFNMPIYDFVTKSRIKFNGYEKIYYSELMNHGNLKIFEEYKKKWNGEYLEPYTDVVKRLSVNQ